MSNSITERIARPVPERPVQQVQPARDKRADAVDTQNQAARAAQEKLTASRSADKGRYVDRYA